MTGRRGKKRSLPEDSGLPRGRPPKKRATGQGKAPEQQSTQESVDSQQEYRARSIIAEKGNKYQIDWEPDSQTGQQYQPTWEPKANANDLLIADWERQKAARKAKELTLVGSSNSSAPALPPKKRGRTRKIVESSPPRSTAQDIATASQIQLSREFAAAIDSGAQTTDAEPEIAPSQQTEGGAEQVAPRAKAFVEPSSPPSSYRAGQYQKFSSSPPTTRDEPEPSQSQSQHQDPSLEVAESSALKDTAQHPPAQSTQRSNNDTSLVIPDSQSQEQLLEESTFRGFSPTQTQRPVPTQDSNIGEQSAQATKKVINQAACASEAQETEPVSSQHTSQDAAPGLESQSQRLQSGADFPVATSPKHDQVAEEASGQESHPHQAHLHSGRRTSSIEQASHQSAADSLAEPQAQSGASERPQTQGQRHTQDSRHRKELNGTAPSEADPKPSSIGTTFGQLSSNSEARSEPVEPSQVSSAGANQVIVISSAENTSGQSSLNFDSSVRPADFEPPPAAQRPPLSSPAKDDNNPIHASGDSQAESHPPFTQQQNHGTSQLETPAGLTQSQPQVRTRHIHYYGTSQSSPGFLTQIPPHSPPKKFESANADFSPARARSVTESPVRARFITASPARSPSVVSSRQADSTPFPSLPSHPLGPVGESAPQPIVTSSDMDGCPIAKRETLAEKMKRTREARAALRQSTTPAPSANGSVISNGQPVSALPPNVVARLGSPLLSAHERSPSTIPAVEAVAPITREEMTTSERYDTLLPKAQNETVSHVNSTLGASTASETQAVADPETAGIHLVPVGPSPQQRDQYQNNIYFDRELTAKVLAKESLDHELLDRANAFLQRLRNTATHPDLINPETLSQKAENEVQARWDISCSAKFGFLNEFIANLSDRNLHIAVVAHGDRIPKMLQNFLQGIKVPCKRWAHPTEEDPDVGPANLGLKVSIVDLDSQIAQQVLQPADVVIAMDPLVDHQHPLVRAARKRTSVGDDNAKWVMLLVLVMPRTIEHLEKCLQADMSPAARTKLLVKATHEMRKEAGRLESTQASVRDAASAIAEYMEDTTGAAEWPIAGLSQLEELESQTESDIQPESHGVKRALEQMDVDDDTAAKKQRQTPAPLEGTINPFDLDITHVSDSLEKGTQGQADPDFASQTATEQKLRQLLQDMQERLDEHVKALSELQYRHEDQRKELVEVKKERDSAITTAERAVARMTSVEADNTALRTERTELKEALGAARQQLLSHTVPEVRELQELRMQAQQSKLEEEKAVKRAAATEKDLEWTRSMYQDASNRVRELAQNNNELETRLAEATVIAQGEQARARQASSQGHNKILEQENKKLRMMVDNMKSGMKNKDEQIAQLKEGRGRMGTRQSSVPRSPRMGSPMKGRMSRQGSPAASDTRGRGAHLHPLRNSAGG
ncbi:hypothetical protein CB0940_09040 [Cercospora beticola]|uniref:Chromo domain-containing protein n=1 Tax=Cercospora beticola TaxID=122368 RepID=A0A2G5HGE6_CERBT|nr:hypothetical protein CB0940_09040 [Cercospora beticola]PIA91565.1 hypothetical protein CB0940_09040 [Cercospora beticola]WPB06685.1 hypothetical protein RHO25_011344 [Cercospora beticola]